MTAVYLVCTAYVLLSRRVRRVAELKAKAE
jgi:hypothetical protein